MVKKITKNIKLKYGVEAVYVGESIDLKRVQESLKQYSFLNRDHPLVLRILKDQYLVLTKFGVVVFWNIQEKLRRQTLKELKPFVKSKKESYPYQEKIKVAVGTATDRVLFGKVDLFELSVDKIKIISYVLAQSAALDRYEDDIEANLLNLEGFMESLKSKGRVMLKERDLLRQIGSTFSVKQTTVAHLSLFDKPDEVWESPELETLYHRLHLEFELQDRFDVLDEKIDFLSENTKMLMDFVIEKRGNFLELIIIILIVVEIALFVVDIFPKLKLW